MAKHSVRQKAVRLLDFLLGLRFRPIRTALCAAGLTPEDREEGWRLLRALGDDEVHAPHLDELPRAGLLDELIAWQGTWYPIAEVTLRRHHPEVAKHVFRNLGRPSDEHAVLMVGFLLDRLEALRAEGSPFGAAGRRALELLARRGLDDARFAEARGLLGKLVRYPSDAEIEQATEAAASASTKGAGPSPEQRLWAYYIEWSTIARKSLRRGDQLRLLGLGPAERAPAKRAPAKPAPAKPAPAKPAPAKRAGRQSQARKGNE